MNEPKKPASLPDDLRQAVALHRSGKLAEAEQLYQRILKADPKHFDACHLLGVIALQRGEPEAALARINAAVEINPRDAAARSNLGNALRDLKRPEEALASYDRAIALQPNLLDAYLNRGHVLRDMKRTDDALASYAKALALNPRHPGVLESRAKLLAQLGRLGDALADRGAVAALQPDNADNFVHRGNLLMRAGRFAEALADFDKALALRPAFAEVCLNRGNALQELGRPADALASYDRALALKPGYADALINRGQLLMSTGRPDEARESLMQALALQPGRAEIHHNLGNIHHQKKEYAKAIPLFERSLEIDKAAHASMFMLADCHFKQNDLSKAFFYAMQAIAAQPQSALYKENFLIYAQDKAVSGDFRPVQAALLECLKTPGLDCTRAHGLWHQIFRADPAYRGVYTTAGESFDAQAFDRAADFGPLTSPYFLLGLEKLCVCVPAFEDFLIRLRRTLLLRPEKFTPEQRTALAAALSHYCLNNEYIFDETDEERAALGKPDDGAAATALRACYAPLHRLGNAADLASRFAADPVLAGVVGAQITEPRRLAEARRSIPAITPVAAGVSAQVREQYEESPYPRWKTVPRHLMMDPEAASLNKKGARILVAGCGTGQEAAELATALPTASILAVDLSLSSLAYAQDKAQQLGLKNITFRQGDILNLGALAEKFDGIASGGVLHHMKDPLEGWRVLASLLAEGGLMRIALYSRAARWPVAAAQEAIKKGGFPATPEGMRAFRRQAASLLDSDTLSRLLLASDYFYMSMYRDLLFHVQEHWFDIPEIERALKQLGLTFLRFIPPAEAMARYRAAFPDDPGGTSLAHWHEFEQAHPDTFFSMYQFWCRKG
jgi:tetratricopeptide (TPR) repeat protein/SAM-dependent methyltransferase